MRLTSIKLSGFIIIVMIIISSCAKEKITSSNNSKSTSTGWEYNNYKNGGFEKID